MKATLKLTNPLWQTAARRRILDQAVRQSAAELEREIKQTILDSVPRGRLYRRGSITARATKAKLSLGLQRKKGTKTRLIAGSKFHRASARGQPPAVDSGKLLRSIRVQPGQKPLQLKIIVGVSYAKRLDDPKGLNRPFVVRSRNNFRRKFKANVQKAIAQNS